MGLGMRGVAVGSGGVVVVGGGGGALGHLTSKR